MRISWDSHEKMTFSWEFSNSHENLSRGFLLMRISFFSWELKAHKNLVRFSWDSHEKMTFSWDFRMSFFYWWESHFSHERWKLMRVSWDSHGKTLSRKLCFCVFSWLHVSCNSLDQEILIENVVSWVSRSHAKANIDRCMHVVLVKENHFEVLSSSKLNMFTWVEIDEVVRSGTCTCTCNVAKNQLCNDWSSYRLWSWSDRSNSNDSDQVVLRTSFEVISSLILKANIPLERSCNFLNEDVLFLKNPIRNGSITVVRS